MGEKPSFMNSTFSIMSLIVVVGITGLCIYTKDTGTLKEITLLLLGAYGVKKGTESKNEPSK